MPVFYANPDPTFQPAMRLITGITKTYPIVITTSFDHDYITGTIVRIYVPTNYGMYQLDGHYGDITVLTSATFSMDINAKDYDSFLAPIPPPDYRKPALCVPIGNLQSAYTAAVRNVL